MVDFMEPWFTVRDIKTVIESMSEFPLEKIAISYCGKILDDDASPRTIRNGRFDVESPFYVLVEERERSDGVKYEYFQIVLRNCDRVFENFLSVSPMETTGEIKNKIGETLGIRPF